jgi:hypothetical protein
MSVQWPAIIPSSPLLDGYSSRKKDSRRITSLDAGLDKMRNRFRATPKFVTESFVFTEQQKVFFENFFDNTTDGGAEVFTRVNPETGLVSNYRFRTVPDYVPLGTNWRVTFEAEILPI